MNIFKFPLLLFLITMVTTAKQSTPEPHIGLHNEIKPQPRAHYCGSAFVRVWRIACLVKQRHNLVFKRISTEGTLT